MNKALIPAALAAGAVLLATGAAQATTLLHVGVGDMTRTSEWVVRAQVVAVSSVDLRSEGRGIFTDVELAIRDVYRGQGVPERTTLRLLGGHGQDGISVWVPGMPRFAPGEEVVLFLERTSRGHVPCGLGQGVWRVHHVPGGQAWVIQDSGGAHVLERTPSGGLREHQGPIATTGKLLGELAAEVYAAQLAEE